MKPAQLFIVISIFFMGTVTSWSMYHRIDEEARRDWHEQSTQQAAKITDSGQFWLSLFFSQMKGVVGLLLTADTVTDDDLLDTYEMARDLEAGIPLMNLAFAQRVERGNGKADFVINLSTEYDGMLVAGRHINEFPYASLLISTALDYPGEVVIGPPFTQSNGAKESLAMLYLETDTRAGLIVSLADITAFASNLEAVHVPPGMDFELYGNGLYSEEKQQDLLIYQPDARTVPVVEQFAINTLVGKYQWRFRWRVYPDYAGGVDNSLALSLLIGGSLFSLLVAMFIAFLFKKNASIQAIVQTRTTA